ncbi:MAG: DUF2080 family transposase-associated protein [Nanoarchaeota archaeon]|nr:DUF2080 family transposase-associated protein [Nanoarchaeota archaeon]
MKTFRMTSLMIFYQPAGNLLVKLIVHFLPEYITFHFVTFFEKVITKFGTNAKLDVPKRYIRRRAYVMIQK